MKISKNRLRVLKKFWSSELVDDAVQDNLAAAFARDEDLRAIPWFKQRLRPRDLVAGTPHGTLKIVHSNGWHVLRNEREELIHNCCTYPSYPAIFSNLDAAKAAALYHVCDGWSTADVLNQLGRGGPADGLYWNLSTAQPAALEYDYKPSDLADDFELRHRETLAGMIRSFGRPAADDIVQVCEAELRACKAAAAAAPGVPQLQLPVWKNPAQGWHTLVSPRGKFVVRRLVGWTAERNGAPMDYIFPPGRLIFDRLEHAKIHALRHAEAEPAELSVCGDGTGWRCISACNKTNEKQKELSSPLR